MKKVQILAVLGLLLLSCSKKDDTETARKTTPVAVNLEFPLNNAVCIEGQETSNGNLLVSFGWRDAEHDYYEVEITNLETEQTFKSSVTTNSFKTELSRNTPFSWKVISRVNDREDKAESDLWKFYTSGEGISNYAPFPAELTAPEDRTVLEKTQLTVDFSWEASDIDDNTLEYDLYLGKNNPPLEVVASGLESPVYSLTLSEGNNLYWRVLTRDGAGNESFSKTRMLDLPNGTVISSFTVAVNDSVYTASIDDEAATINLTLGNFSYSEIAPTIEIQEGASINPQSGVPLNFLDDLFYEVTLPDGTLKRYDLVLTSGQHEVESFRVFNGTDEYIGMIDHEEGTIEIELGNLDYSSITPEIVLSPSATSDPAQTEIMDVSSPYTFTVTSERGTTKAYVVKAPIKLSRIYGYFRNPGFQFYESSVGIDHRVFAGATQYIHASNIQDVSQVALYLVSDDGTPYQMEVFRSSYSHAHSFESSNSTNLLTVIVPDGIPSGKYSFLIEENNRSTAYPHMMEVINDDSIIRITEINKTDLSLRDTLVIKGFNLKKRLAIKSFGSTYLYSDYSSELSVNAEGTEMQFIISGGVYNNLRWGGSSREKPLAIQTSRSDYSNTLNSNIIYFNIN
ncbi:DUF5018 domain-containing protein [Robertkochia flava]|uniref:DUF5018 domain-containing protein n=1 Tax=Robertkochia flava TaxID=3447986 RepID=UPI001CC92276|nr:DUF5018 domain-containing protein [Robertkochia marina]